MPVVQKVVPGPPFFIAYSESSIFKVPLYELSSKNQWSIFLYKTLCLTLAKLLFFPLLSMVNKKYTRSWKMLIAQKVVP